jgi:hypothetical protein
VHEGRGADRVRWAIDGSSVEESDGGGGCGRNVLFTEAGIERWEDPSPEGSNKMSLVDLTAKGGGGKRALDNDGSHPHSHAPSLVEEPHPYHDARLDMSTWSTHSCRTDDEHTIYDAETETESVSMCTSSIDNIGCCGMKTHSIGAKIDDSQNTGSLQKPTGNAGAGPGIGTHGLGGDPDTTARCDREALVGRMGRRETCVVNAAIMANSYPHIGGKRFNKPIVVDLDLPVWR